MEHCSMISKSSGRYLLTGRSSKAQVGQIHNVAMKSSRTVYFFEVNGLDVG